MIKVLQVTGLMNRGGAEVMLMDILRNKPDDVHFDFLVNNHPSMLTERGSFDDEIIARGCVIRYIGSQWRLGPIKYIKEFKKIIAELKPDVVHIHLNAKCGIIALAAHKAGIKKIIAHCHADIRFRGSRLSNAFNEFELWCQKWLISRYASEFWGCSVEANRRLYRGKDFENSVVINNAISCDLYRSVSASQVAEVRQSYNLPSDAVILGNVGRIVRHKGVANIVEVVSELVRRGVNAHFVIAGRNDAKEYVDTMLVNARERNVENRIHFLGERSDIPIVMHTFDVFVGPALKEGFGLVAVEAQAAAVPCVLYNGFPRTVDMQVGLVTFIEDFDTCKWSDAIVEAYNSPKADKQHILDVIKQRGFDARENAKRVCELYKK